MQEARSLQPFPFHPLSVFLSFSHPHASVGFFLIVTKSQVSIETKRKLIRVLIDASSLALMLPVDQNLVHKSMMLLRKIGIFIVAVNKMETFVRSPKDRRNNC